MKRLDTLLLKVYLYGLPAVVIFAVLSHLYGLGSLEQTGGANKILHNFEGLVLAVWLVLSLYLSVRLIVSGSFRNKVLARMTFIRERDEREAALTGKAARTTFLTSLAVLILLFCLSCFHVSFYRLPPEKAVGGKTGVVSLGFGFKVWGTPQQEPGKGALQGKSIISYNGLPVSTMTVILFMIICQIACYNYTIHRLTRCYRG